MTPACAGWVGFFAMSPWAVMGWIITGECSVAVIFRDEPPPSLRAAESGEAIPDWPRRLLRSARSDEAEVFVTKQLENNKNSPRVSRAVRLNPGIHFTKIVFGNPSAAKNLSRKASALTCACVRMPSSMAALRISSSAAWRASVSRSVTPWVRMPVSRS